MKKRIFAGLLTLVMAFTLLPVSALAEAGDWDPLTDPKDVDGSLVGNKTFTASDTLQTDRDGQLKVMPIYQVTSGYTTTTYNAMAYCGAEAASSDTDVVEVKQTDDGKQDIVIGTWEGGDFHGADCLQVNVTPKKAGRAVVTISFYYTFSQNSNPLTSSNTKWFNGTMEYTVNVTEPVAKPDQPDAGIYKGTYGNEGKKYAIVLECDREKTHTYAYKSLKDVENGYTMGEVAVNDGSTGRSPSDYPYICPMTINYAPWVNAVNAQFAKDGEHSLSGTAQSETIYWYYGTDGKWYTTEDDAAPVRIGITCTEPEPDPEVEYTLNYDANGGENAPTSQTAKSSTGSATFTISGTTPTLKGYDFQGWSTTKGGAVQYQPDGSITVTATETTLYAVWEKKVPEVTPPDAFLKNAITVLVKHVDDGAAHIANVGRYPLSGNSSADYEVGAVTTENGVTTCTVTIKNAQLYLDKYDKSVKAGTHRLADGETAEKTIKLTWDADTGKWTFTPVEYQVTCQEKKQIEYELTYDANAGEDEVKNVPAKDSYVDTKSYHIFNIPTMVPEREGYTFKGWASSAEASVAMFQPGKTITVQSGEPSKTLYALWELNSYTVTFNADNGTEAAITTVKHGQTVAEPTAPTKAGYNFDGWFLNGVEFDFTTAIESDITLTAQWTKRSSGGSGSSSRDYDYTLRYVTNGGKAIASETKSKSWTKDYEDLPMPTRAGYRFDGWYYDSALKKEVTGDVKVNSRTVTLYAGWTGSSVPDSLNGEDHFAYVQGYADGTVRPNTPVTRAQVATILFRLLDESVRKEYLTESNTFTDVAANYWANTAISTMANMGVFKGRTADRFDPNAPITRGEFAAVCARFDDSKVKTTETYSDIDGYWAANEILRAAALGWVQGYQDGSYRPNNSITRAQVVTMINRVLCRMPEKNADLLKGMSSFTDCAEDDWCYLAIQEATNSHGYKTKSGSIHEKWTDLNTAPDWSRFEH